MDDLAGLRARALGWAAGCGLPPRRCWRVAIGVADATAEALGHSGAARVTLRTVEARIEAVVAGTPPEGCALARQVADDFARDGDQVRLGWTLPAPGPAAPEPPAAGLDALRAEDRALLALLDGRDAEVRALREEIEATSHGLIALHAELESARQAEARLAAIVQSSGDAMYSLTPEETVASWNEGAELLLGHAAGEIIGRSVRALFPAAEREGFTRALAALQAGERAARYDAWCHRRDGSRVEVGVTLSAIRGEDGDPIGYSVVLHDLTERRRIQAELAAARTRAGVAAERERIAQDLHDLVIQRLYASGMFLDLARKVESRAELDTRIDRVIDDLDATIAEIRSTIFALGQPVAGLRAQLLQMAAEAAEVLGFRPRVHFTGPVDTVVAPGVGEQVLAVAREALSNIARHAQASAADLTLRASDEVVLEVADDGRGIGDTTRSSGLGNMRRRAEALGGAFDVTSEPGHGTRLVWRVPARGPMP